MLPETQIIKCFVIPHQCIGLYNWYKKVKEFQNSNDQIVCSYRGSTIDKWYQFTDSYELFRIFTIIHEMTSYLSIESLTLTRRSNIEFSMDWQPEHRDRWTFYSIQLHVYR